MLIAAGPEPLKQDVVCKRGEGGGGMEGRLRMDSLGNSLDALRVMGMSYVLHVFCQKLKY